MDGNIILRIINTQQRSGTIKMKTPVNFKNFRQASKRILDYTRNLEVSESIKIKAVDILSYNLEMTAEEALEKAQESLN